jgi:hypothetical protein
MRVFSAKSQRRSDEKHGLTPGLLQKPFSQFDTNGRSGPLDILHFLTHFGFSDDALAEGAGGRSIQVPRRKQSTQDQAKHVDEGC